MTDLLDILARDHRPTPTDIRAAIRRAVTLAAAEHDGVVSIATIRPHLPEWSAGPMLGAYMTALVRKGVLVWTGAFDLSGNRRQRNALRPVKTYYLAQPVPEED